MIPIESLLPFLRDPRDGGTLSFEPNGSPGGGHLHGTTSGASYAVKHDVADLLVARPGHRHRFQGAMDSPRLAAIYERVWRPFVIRPMVESPLDLESEYTMLRALLPQVRPWPILDLSCGPGLFTFWLARDHAADVILGVDLSEAMLDEALRRGEREGPEVHEVGLVRADAARLPLADRSIGAVLTSTAIHLYTDPDAVFREVKRVLVPGGAYVGMAVRKEPPVGLRQLVRRAGGRAFGLRLFGEEELRAALVSAGFDTFERILLGPTFAFRAQTLGPAALDPRCATCPSRTAPPDAPKAAEP